MTTVLELALRYGGAISVEPTLEGWRLTCSDDDGEIATVHLTRREADRLVESFRPQGGDR